MKKRILSLILVVVMLTLTLAGCSYSFVNDDMSKYATYDQTAFAEALKALKIEDADFTPTEDGEIRNTKVIETIYNTIGKLADTSDKKTAGVIGEWDILYYAYYCTANFEGQDNVILGASNMKASSATSLQFGITSTASELSKAIMEALAGKNIEDYLYVTEESTSTELKAGDKVYVSYTYEYKPEGENDTKKVLVSYDLIELSEDDELGKAMIDNCKKVGTKADFTIVVDGVERKYTNAVVELVVKSDKEPLLSFDSTDFDDTQSMKDVSGASRKLADIKDDTLTYHIYPIGFVEVEELNATLILKSLFGANITKDLLDLFSDESYYVEEEGDKILLSKLVEELAALCKEMDDAQETVDTAQKTYDNAKAAYDKVETPSDEQKNTLENAETALEEAKEKLESATGKVDAKVGQILGSGDDMETKIVDGYKELARETLEDDYNSQILEKIAKEVWTLINTTVKVNDYPADAVREMYDRILENHKAIFYTEERDSDTGESYYKYYSGSFENYLIDTFAKGKTYDDALAAIEEDAKEAVKPIIQIYAVAAKYNCVVTDAEYNEYIKGDSSYESNVYSYGETNLRTAYQFDKLLDTILEYDTVKDGDDEKMGAYVDRNDDGVKEIPFKNINYTFKAEEEDTEGEE